MLSLDVDGHEDVRALPGAEPVAGRADEPARAAPAPGDVEADVAIVGAGYTGLWTAYYLSG